MYKESQEVLSKKVTSLAEMLKKLASDETYIVFSETTFAMLSTICQVLFLL